MQNEVVKVSINTKGPFKKENLFSKFVARVSPLILVGIVSACVAKDRIPETSPVEIISIEILSYDSSTTRLLMKAILNVDSEITDFNTVEIFSSSRCIGTSIGKSTYAGLTTAGVKVDASSTKKTPLFLKTNTLKNCFFIIEYDPLHAAPPVPSYTSISPISPSKNSTSPVIFGKADPSTAWVRFFDEETCKNEVGKGPGTHFPSPGIVLNLQANKLNRIYAKSVEIFGAASACTFLTDYIHTDRGPLPPVFGQSIPISPSHLTLNPKMLGTPSLATSRIEFYTNADCSVKIGDGTATDFKTTGIAVDVEENGTLSIYSKAFDTEEASSTCQFFTVFEHDSIAPGAPSFLSLSPGSPTRATLFPTITGTAPGGTAQVALFSDPICTIQIGIGNTIQFETNGVSATGVSNGVRPLYGASIDQAGNRSACVYFTDFENDTLPPDPPVFAATSPASPNNLSTTPRILGTPSFDTTLVRIYKDLACTQEVGTGTPEVFRDLGILVTLDPNTETTLTATSTDAVGNVSDCVTLVNYRHSTLPAENPVFSRTVPVSPTNISSQPFIIGSVSNRVVSLRFFSDSSCQIETASGSRATFTTVGIRYIGSPNTIGPIYAKAVDIYGNISACQFMTNYTHTNIIPLVPGFTSTTPTSPNNVTSNPLLAGSVNQNPYAVIPSTNVALYDSSICINRIGLGTVSDFTTIGIQISAYLNATTSVYGQTMDAAGNRSACAFITDYTVSQLVPGRPLFVSATPGSPSYTAKTFIRGNLGTTSDFLNPDYVQIFTDSNCSVQIAGDTPAKFGYPGILVNVPLNSTTPLFSRTRNVVGTFSECRALTSFRHSNGGPSGLSATLGLNGTVNLSWLPDQTASPVPTYTLKRSLKPGGPYTILVTGLSGTSFTDSAVNKNTNYFYVVSAANSTGTTLNSSEIQMTTSDVNPNPPGSLFATPGPAEVSLSWSGFNTAHNYKVYRSPNRSGPFNMVNKGVSGLNYVDRTVTNGTPYYYVVRATNPTGTSVQSNVAGAIPQDSPPTPTQVKTTGFIRRPDLCPTGTGVVVVWSKPSHFSQFQVYLGEGSGAFNLRATVSSNFYIECTLTTNVNENINQFAIRATWGTELSPMSEPASFHNYPAASFVAHPGDGHVQLSWQGVPFATHYQLTRSSSPAGPFQVIENATTNSQFFDTNVSNGNSYFYQLLPYYGSGGTSFPAETVSATPKSNVGIPTHLTLGSSNRQPSLTWIPPKNFNTFRIYRGTTALGPWDIAGETSVSNFTDSGATLGMNYYRVVAQWGIAETGSSNIVSFLSGFPTGVSATVLANSIRLNWTMMSGAVSYNIYRGNQKGGPYVSIATGILTTAFEDTTTSPDTGYTYVVSATFADHNESFYSNEVSATIGSKPDALTIVAKSLNSITLSWSRVSGPPSRVYRVFRGLSATGPWVRQLPDPNTETRIVSGLSSQTRYYFYVTSFMSGSESARSNIIDSITYSRPGAPTVGIGNNQLDVQWSPVVGAISYSLLRSTNSVTFSPVATGLTNTFLADNLVSNGELYFYQVQAVFPAETITSESSTGATPGIVPDSPAGVMVMENSSGTNLIMGWGAVPSATTYSLYMSATSGGPWGAPFLNSSSNLNILVDPIMAGSTHFFSVSALNGTNESAKSTEIAVRVEASPLAPIAQVLTDGTIEINWPSVTNANTYEVERTENGIKYIPVGSGIATTSYIDSSVSAGATYQYRYLPVQTGVTRAASSPSPRITPGIRPLAPGAFISSAINSTTVSLAWIGMPNVISYNIYRSGFSGSGFVKIANIFDPTTQYTDSGLTPGNSYFYVITSTNDSGVESINSEEGRVKLSASPTGLSAIASNGSNTLSWNALGGANSYAIYRGETSSGPYGLLSEGVVGNSFSDPNTLDAVTYYYVISAKFSDLTLSPFSNEASATAIQKMNLQIPIELIDRPLLSRDTEYTFERTLTSFDTDAYDGMITYEFEAMVTNFDSIDRNIYLVNGSNSNVATLSIPALSTQPRRIRTTFSPTGGSHTFRIGVEATSSVGNVEIKWARILVSQVGATRTKIYFSLISSFMSPSEEDTTAPSDSTQNTDSNFELLHSGSLLKRDTLAFSQLVDYNPWEFEVVVAAKAGREGFISLWNHTQSTNLIETGSYFSTTVPTLIRAPFQDGISQFGVANEGDLYGVAMACIDQCTSSGDVLIYRAGLWLSLSSLSKADIPFRNHLGKFLIQGTNTIVESRTFIELNKFSNPLVSLQATVVPAFGDILNIKLNTNGTQDSGIGVLVPIVGSDLQISGTAKTLGRSVPFSIVSGHRFVPVVATTEMGSALIDTQTVIRISK